jgi:WD40 repeat protein
MWVLRNLLAGDWETPVLEQEAKSWKTWETAFLPGGKHFLVWGGPRDGASPGCTIEAWDKDTGKQLWQLSSDMHYYNCGVVWNPSGTVLAYTPSNTFDLAEVYRLPRGTNTAKRNHFPHAISPSGSQFVERQTYGFFLHESEDYDQGVTLGTDFVATARPVFSPDGHHLAMPTAEGWVLVAELNTVLTNLSKLGWPSR